MSLEDNQILRAALSRNIRNLRKAQGLAQERLGLEAGVDRTFVSKLEREIGNPTLDILVKLANRLGVKVIDLLRVDDDLD